MTAHFSAIDYLIFGLYAVLIVGLGLWISKTKKGEEKTADDYFLANKSLTWWAIGASLLAANISAEHFIAMSGSGFITGLGIAAYEWVAALTLIVVGKYFLPIFLEKKIYTMPQFTQERFSLIQFQERHIVVLVHLNLCGRLIRSWIWLPSL